MSKDRKMMDVEAGDIMIPLDQYPHIPFWFTIRQAVAELEHSDIEVNGRRSLPRALLVFDETYQLLGIVRRRDILKKLEPEYLHTSVRHQKKLFDVEVDTNLAEFSFEKESRIIREKAEMLVSEVMLPIEESVALHDHLAKIIYIMVHHDQNLVPVVESDNVVGVVRSVDVFHEVAEIIL
ncbi:CBS domain-containing protein [bacterium]|nr:CBS domain-containing protein [bacterium]